MKKIKTQYQVKAIDMKKLMSCLHILVVFLVLFSCSNKKEDNVFAESPSERIKKSEDELRKLLTSAPYGWDFFYTPSEGESGSYYLYIKFFDKDSVVISSDYNKATIAPAKSTYDIVLGSTTKLVFDTYNAGIHLFLDGRFSPISGARGSGLKGELEFLYQSHTENEITFKGNRNFNTHKFIKRTTLANPAGEAGQVTKYWDSLSSGGNMVFKQNGVEIKYRLSIGNQLLRSVNITGGKPLYNPTGLLITGNGDKTFIEPTKTGFKLKKVTTPEGKVIENVAFTYDLAKKVFVNTQLGATISFPPENMKPLEEVFSTTTNRLVCFPNYTPSGRSDIKTSDTIKNLFNKVRSGGKYGTYFALLLYEYKDGSDLMSYFFMPGSGVNSIRRKFGVEHKDNGSYAVLKDRGFVVSRLSTPQPAIANTFNSLKNILMDTLGGWKLVNHGKVYSFAPSYDIYQFISIKDPSIKFTAYLQKR